MQDVVKQEATLNSAAQEVVLSGEVRWPGDKGPPQDVPPCGFTGDAVECRTAGYHFLQSVASINLYVNSHTKIALQYNLWLLRGLHVLVT